MIANTLKKNYQRVTWNCVRGGKSSFTVCQELVAIFRRSILDLLGKALEDDISCQGPQIIVKHLTVTTSQEQQNDDGTEVMLLFGGENELCW
jgi:hypothetical protein